MAITLDKLLESVTDAVSTMVIFANDAGNNSAVLKNLARGSEGVRNAVTILVGQARETVTLWEQLGSSEMSQRMSACCDGLMSAVNGIVRCCTDIQNSPKDPEPKAQLLEEGKDVLRQMVGLLQFNDLYDVMNTLKKISVAEDLTEAIDQPNWIPDDFASLVRDIADSLQRRHDNTNDNRVKHLLEESKGDLEKLGPALATIVKRSRQDDSFKAKIPLVMGPLQETLQKASKAVKLSSKSPFDLGLLDADFRHNDEDHLNMIAIGEDFMEQLNAVKKAIKKGDEFELERAVRAIEKDFMAQIAAAEEMAEATADPYIRQLMQNKINAAKSELGNLLEKLRSDGMAALDSHDPSKIEALLAEARRLYGMVAAGQLVNELLKANESLDALLNELPPAVDSKNEVESKALNKDIAKEVEIQAVLAQSIAEGIDDDFRKQRILNNVGKLQALTPVLADTTAEALKDKPGARNKLDQVIEKMREANNDLNICIATTTPEELMERATVIDKSLRDLKKHGDPDPFAHKVEINDEVNELLSQVKPQVATATNWANAMQTDDPDLSMALKEQAQALDKASNKLAADAKALLSGPSSGAKFNENKQRFLDSVAAVETANDQLVSSAIEAADDQMEALKGRLLADLKNVKGGVKEKDVRGTARALAETNRDGREMAYLAKLIAGDLQDPTLKNKLRSNADELSSKIIGLTGPAKTAAKDPSKQKVLDNHIKDVEKTIDTLVELASQGSPEDKMVQNADLMNKIDKRYLQDLEKGQGAKATQTLQEQQKKVNKQKHLADQVAERCTFDKSLGDKLIAETNKLDLLLSEVEKRGEAVKKNPSDQKAQKALKDAADAFEKQSTLTGKLAQDIKNARKEAEERAKEEARRAEEEARRLAEERKRKAEAAVPVGIKEIWMDAQDLLEKTQAIKTDNSPIGDLVRLAEELAKLMQQLAAQSKTGTKKDIIMLSRKIADTITNLHALIGKVADGCRDKILNGEMNSQGNVSKNFAIQLKILGSVKANLVLEDDPDTRQSLVICARGLCKSVNDIVALSQVAKLKPKK